MQADLPPDTGKGLRMLC